MNKQEYHEYLQSDRWRAKRTDALDRAGHACQLCSSKHRLQVHHRTYDRVGEELPSDLIALCRDCHARFHDKLADDGARERAELAPPRFERKAHDHHERTFLRLMMTHAEFREVALEEVTPDMFTVDVNRRAFQHWVVAPEEITLEWMSRLPADMMDFCSDIAGDPVLEGLTPAREFFAAAMASLKRRPLEAKIDELRRRMALLSSDPTRALEAAAILDEQQAIRKQIVAIGGRVTPGNLRRISR